MKKSRINTPGINMRKFLSIIFTFFLLILSAYIHSDNVCSDMAEDMPKHIRLINMIENTENIQKKMILSVMLEYRLDELEDDKNQLIHFYNMHISDLQDLEAEDFIYTQKNIRKCKDILDNISAWRKKYCDDIWRTK